VEDIKLADIALANLSIQTGRFGSEAETAYESMQRLRAEWNNFKEEAGKGLVAVIDVVYRFMQQGAAAGIKGEADLYGTGSPWYSGQPSYRGKITAERPYDPTSEGNLLRAEAERDKFWAVEKMKTAIAEKEGQKRGEEIARLNERIEDMWARQVLTVEEQATRQADIWRRKGADRVLVEEWLANELERIRISEDARLTERLSKIYEREQKNALAIAEIYADTEARSAISRLNFQKQILSEKEGLGLMTASERLLAEHDLARKILEAEESRLRVLLTRKSQHITEDDLRGQREILKLALEHREISKQLLEVEEMRILRMKEFSGSFSEGLDAGARKYFSEIEGSFRRGRTQAEQTARGMEQAFSDGFFAVFTGQVDRLEDVWTNFCHSMARAWSDTLAQMVMESLKGSGGGLFGGLASILSGAESFDLFALLGGGSGMFFEEGGIFSAGRLVPFAAGGIVERPTVFRMASGMGLMGEDGPEAVMPLGRTASGELGVKGMGSGGVVIVNNILMAESVGINAEQMYQAMKTASRGIMDDSDLMQKAAKGIAQGLRSDELVAIAEGARYAARLAGEDVKTAYETITDAIANQMPKALRQYGLVTKEEMSLLNKAMAAGVEDIKLADIALANLSIQTGRFGSEAETAYESMQRLRAEWNNMKEEAGKGIVAVVDVIYRTFLQRSPGEAESIAGINALGEPMNMGYISNRANITEKPETYEIDRPTMQLLRAQRDKFALLGGGSGMFFEEGGIFSAGRLIPFAAGGIVERPTVFRMASGMGLMGEDGPEAVMPLGRTASGELGVKGMGSGGVVIVNNIRAIDTQSFADVCRRNPQAITQTVSSEMKDGKLKHWKPFMGG
jgi:lambda family phage tail tape measure protein